MKKWTSLLAILFLACVCMSCASSRGRRHTKTDEALILRILGGDCAFNPDGVFNLTVDLELRSRDEPSIAVPFDRWACLRLNFPQEDVIYIPLTGVNPKYKRAEQPVMMVPSGGTNLHFVYYSIGALQNQEHLRKTNLLVRMQYDAHGLKSNPAYAVVPARKRDG